MSEIKGQILGVILVLMVFAVVAGTMTTVFNNLSRNITDKVSQLETETSQEMMIDKITTFSKH